MNKLILFISLIIVVVYSASLTLAADGWASVADTSGTPYNLTGGSAGSTVTVTTANDLKNYATSSLPYVIQVSGYIDLSSLSNHTLYPKSNKTIIGIGTLPTIYGHIDIKNGYSNIIIQRLNINYNADEGSEDPWTDGITIQDYAHHIWVNHCSVYNSPDGLIDVCGAADFVTISWCKFFYQTGIYNTAHHFTNLVGSSDSDYNDRGKLHITFHHNWWADLCHERMPRVRFGQVHVYNNYYSCSGNNYCIHPGVEAQLLVEKNYFNTVDEPIDEPEADALVHATGNTMSHCTNVHGEVGGDTVFTPPYPYRPDESIYIRFLIPPGAGADGVEPPPPAIPTGLKATSTAASIVLDWNDNPETGVKYNVYRSTTSGSGFTKLNLPTNPLSSSTYIDYSVVYGTKYYYVVTSMSSVYSESDFSSQVSSIPRIYGDFEINNTVDFNDLRVLSDLWLVNDCSQTADVDYDGDCMVNFIEFQAMAANWLIQQQ